MPSPPIRRRKISDGLPDLVAELRKLRAALGVETAREPGAAKNVIFAWFENTKAALNGITATRTSR